ncbi:MAG: SpoIIE family protein phosphatase [Calditrichaeota bacterium]|nr:SpoIIE family protein phosphatase [Calditrichota bacterium]
MKKQYVKALIYSFLVSPISYLVVWMIFDGLDLIKSVEFIITFIALQILYISGYLLINRRIEKVLYVESSRLIEKLKLLIDQINRIHSSKELIDLLAATLNSDFKKVQPLIYFKRKKTFYLVNHDVNAIEHFKLKRKKQRIVNSLLESDRMMISGRKIDFHDVFDRDISELIFTEHVSHIVPLHSDNELIGIAFVSKRLSKLFYDHKLVQKLEIFFNTISAIFQKAQLFDMIQKKSLENKILLEVGRNISSSLDLRTVLKSILDGLKQILNYDAAGIFLKKTNEEYLERLYTIGYDNAALDNYNLKQNHGVVKWVFEHQRPVAIPDVNADPRYYNVRPSTKSQLTVPLFKGDELMGAFILEKDHLNFYTDDVIETSLTFAQHASIAIVNAQLYQISKNEKALQTEMINAGNIQKALLLKRPLVINNFEAALLNKPYKFVGGDVYDMYKFNDDEMIFNIGDVSGKGSPASILMAVIYAGFRSFIRTNLEVSEYNARLNHLLYETTSSTYYATFFTGYINQQKRELTYSNAGHNPPLLIRADQSVLQLKTGGMVLGFIQEESYLQERVSLKNKDILVLFTDGLNEAFDNKEEEFGNDRIIEIVQKNFDRSVHELKYLIYDAVKKFHGKGENLDDDITLIIMRFIYD